MELTKCHRHSTETITEFKLQHHTKLNICEYNNTRAFNGDCTFFYISYLHSLHHLAMNPVIMSINTQTADGRDWASIDTFDSFHSHALRQINSYSILHPASNLWNSNNQPARGTPTTTTTTDTKCADCVEVLATRIRILEEKLCNKTLQDVTRKLKHYASKHQGCFFPNSNNHLFKDCSLLPPILEPHRCTPCLTHAFLSRFRSWSPLLRNLRVNLMRGPAITPTMEQEQDNLHWQQAQVS